MKITQARNATILIEANGYGLLVDPFLGRKRRLPPFRIFTWPWRMNPLVDWPENREEILEKTTHCLITHRHPDHIDTAGMRWLGRQAVPVYCRPHDAGVLSRKGLRVSLIETGIQPFLEGTIQPVKAQHGRGILGRLMGQVSGYFLELPGQPSLYLASDTVLTEQVKDFLHRYKPDISVIPAGGARFDIGKEIIMGLSEALAFARLTSGTVIANHLEALDHCRVSRDALKQAVEQEGLESRFLIPGDGQSLDFS